MVGGTGGILKLFVPFGYVSGSPLSSTSTWENASFASLGLTPRTYLKPFGSGANADSVVVVVAVPEPATLGIVGMAALTLVRRRRLWGEKKG